MLNIRNINIGTVRSYASFSDLKVYFVLLGLVKLFDTIAPIQDQVKSRHDEITNNRQRSLLIFMIVFSSIMKAYKIKKIPSV